MHYAYIYLVSESSDGKLEIFKAQANRCHNIGRQAVEPYGKKLVPKELWKLILYDYVKEFYRPSLKSIMLSEDFLFVHGKIVSFYHKKYDKWTHLSADDAMEDSRHHHHTDASHQIEALLRSTDQNGYKQVTILLREGTLIRIEKVEKYSSAQQNDIVRKEKSIMFG